MFDSVVVFEEHSVRQLAHLVETALGAVTLSPRHARLPTCPGDPRQQSQADRRGCDNSRPVPFGELRRAVTERVLARPHRPSLQMASNVLRESLDRGVAALWFLAKRH